jgi:uncharacterized protein GlcG (DUF336 family)
MRFEIVASVLLALGLTGPVDAQLTAADVTRVIEQAVTRAVSISGNSVIAVTDREGYVLGVWNVRGGEPTDEQIATAVSKAGTAAFLSSNQNAFTSRTAGFIIQQHFPPGVRNAAPGPLSFTVFATVLTIRTTADTVGSGSLRDALLAAPFDQQRQLLGAHHALRLVARTEHPGDGDKLMANADYLRTKRERMGHLLEGLDDVL